MYPSDFERGRKKRSTVLRDPVTVSETDDSFSSRMRGTRSAGWQYSSIDFPTSSSASNPSTFRMDGATYTKNPLRDKTYKKSGEHSSNMRFSNWLLSCVFSNVGDIVLVEIGKIGRASCRERVLMSV